MDWYVIISSVYHRLHNSGFVRRMPKLRTTVYLFDPSAAGLKWDKWDKNRAIRRMQMEIWIIEGCIPSLRFSKSHLHWPHLFTWYTHADASSFCACLHELIHHHSQDLPPRDPFNDPQQWPPIWPQTPQFHEKLHFSPKEHIHALKRVVTRVLIIHCLHMYLWQVNGFLYTNVCVSPLLAMGKHKMKHVFSIGDRILVHLDQQR